MVENFNDFFLFLSVLQKTIENLKDFFQHRWTLRCVFRLSPMFFKKPWFFESLKVFCIFSPMFLKKALNICRTYRNVLRTSPTFPQTFKIWRISVIIPSADKHCTWLRPPLTLHCKECILILHFLNLEKRCSFHMQTKCIMHMHFFKRAKKCILDVQKICIISILLGTCSVGYRNS